MLPSEDKSISGETGGVRARRFPVALHRHESAGVSGACTRNGNDDNGWTGHRVPDSGRAPGLLRATRRSLAQRVRTFGAVVVGQGPEEAGASSSSARTSSIRGCAVAAFARGEPLPRYRG
ncbi:hypothetical protein GCM10009602_67600 [Nocardiopsis tropica]